MALLAMGLALVLAAAARPSPQSSASANAALQSTTRNTSAQSTKIVLLGTGTPSPDPDRSGPATAVVVNGTPYLIDFGPGAGVQGGRIVHAGTPQSLERAAESLTGAYLSGRQKIEVPEKRRQAANAIKLLGASENNLADVDVAADPTLQGHVGLVHVSS